MLCVGGTQQTLMFLLILITAPFVSWVNRPLIGRMRKSQMSAMCGKIPICAKGEPQVLLLPSDADLRYGSLGGRRSTLPFRDRTMPYTIDCAFAARYRQTVRFVFNALPNGAIS
jgi:hypothetical protein